MKLRLPLILALIVPGIASALSANQWASTGVDSLDCQSGNAMEIGECFDKKYEASDKALNAVYKKLYSGLKNPSALQRSQRDWLKFRDSQCEFDAGTTMNSERNFSIMRCHIYLNMRRVSDLNEVQICNGCPEFKDEVYKGGGWK